MKQEMHIMNPHTKQRAQSGEMLLAYSVGPETVTDLTVKSYTWEAFVERMSKAKEGEKSGSYIIRGGDLLEPKRKDANLLSAELLVIDGEAGFDGETGKLLEAVDPDTGEIKSSAPPIEVARDALERLGYRYVLHVTHSNAPDILNRWRAYVPAKMANKDELKAVAEYVVAQLQGEGCFIKCVDEMTTFSQPWYLPRVKPQYRDAYKCFASLVGRDIDVAAAVNWYAAQQRREKAFEAAKVAKPKAEHQGDKFISDFNRAADEGWFLSKLKSNGYRFCGKHGDTLRFIAPKSESKTPGVSVYQSNKGDLIAYSWHGSHDPLSHRTSTAFDLVMMLDHGGNFPAAFEAVKRAAGVWNESSAANTDDFTPEQTEVAQDTPSRRRVWNPWAEHAVPPFPLDVLPDDIARYIEARAEETGACKSAIGMAVLTAASGAITHEAKVYLKPGKHYPVGPRLWTAIIGPPSAKKSPAIDGAVMPLIRAQKEIQAVQWRRWKEAQEGDGKKRNSRPELTKYTDNDLTPEGLVDTLAYQSRGLLVVADELSGFLTGFDRYGAGKGAASGRAVWLQAYNGGYYAATRSSRVVPPVENLSVSVLGGIQPERLLELNGLTSDGLLQRFLPVWMSKPALDSDRFDQSAWRAWDDRVRGLLDIGRFSTELETDAQKERKRIAEFLFNLGQIESEGTSWQGYVGKQAGVWGSLALILHCLWEPMVGTGLKADNARRASLLIEEFLLPHGLAFYREIAGGSQGDNRNIAGFLAGWTEPTIKVRNLALGPRCCRGVTPDVIVKQMQPFEAGGWLIPMRPGPTNREWKIRPKLAEMFAAELERHRTALAAVQDKIRGLSDD